MPDNPLSQDMMKSIVSLTIETYKEMREKDRKHEIDRKLHNTRLLLENYRSFISFDANAVYDAAKCNEDVYEILSLMSGNPSKEELYVESIKRSVGRTKLIIAHINRALESYKDYCVSSGKPEELRRYRIIQTYYLDNEIVDPQTIADNENIDISTVYKDIKEGIKRLTPRIFGVDGFRV